MREGGALTQAGDDEEEEEEEESSSHSGSSLIHIDTSSREGADGMSQKPFT